MCVTHHFAAPLETVFICHIVLSYWSSTGLRNSAHDGCCESMKFKQGCELLQCYIAFSSQRLKKKFFSSDSDLVVFFLHASIFSTLTAHRQPCPYMRSVSVSFAIDNVPFIVWSHGPFLSIVNCCGLLKPLSVLCKTKTRSPHREPL